MIFVSNIIFFFVTLSFADRLSQGSRLLNDIIGYAKWCFFYEIQETFLAIHLKLGFKEIKRHDLSQENSDFCIFDVHEGHSAI